MGTVKMGGSGCICPEHAFLRALMQHLLLGPQEALVIDMEAGMSIWEGLRLIVSMLSL